MTTTPTPPTAPNWDYLKKAVENWPKTPTLPPPPASGFGRR